MARPIKCEQCGNNAVLVLETRHTTDYVRRRRYCEFCGCTYTTYEIPYNPKAIMEENARLKRKLIALKSFVEEE